MTPNIATLTAEVRIRRLWLFRLNCWLWCQFGWLFPWADPAVITARIVRVLRPEMRISRRRGWEPLGQLEVEL